MRICTGKGEKKKQIGMKERKTDRERGRRRFLIDKDTPNWNRN